MHAWCGRFGNDHSHMLRREDRRVCEAEGENIVTAVRAFDEARDDEAMEPFARPFAEQFLTSPIAIRASG
jgi:hypothetical protein